MLTEHEVIRQWRKLFNGCDVTKDTIGKAQKLLNELSLESPLRLRFGNELEDIKSLVRESNTKS